MARPAFPFVPKSNRELRPGDYWDIPLPCGKFACGRVIQLPSSAGPGARSLFLAGLLDWSSARRPDDRSIAGARTLRQGQAHIISIPHVGGRILGNRPLELDGIEPQDFLDRSGGDLSTMRMRGLEILRRASPEERRTLPSLATWGMASAQAAAEDRFCAGHATLADKG